jgi:hypothetical protein
MAMTRSLTAVASCARWLAVFAVVLYHVRFLLFTEYDHLLVHGIFIQCYYFLTSLGHEGFVVYMVASGMLLGGLSWRRWSCQGVHAWRDVAHKAVWFYALLVPALLLGAVFDVTGTRILHWVGVYRYFAQFDPSLSVAAVLENLFPVQRFLVPGLGSNAMLFLLAYECWAYLAFAAYGLLGQGRRGVLCGALIVAAGALLEHEFLGYALLWAGGALALRHRVRLSGHVGPGTALVIFVAGLLLSRLGGTQVSALPPQLVLPARALLDVQFGGAAALLLLAMGRTASQHQTRYPLLRRLNRLAPSANSAILASHFPFMMLVVAAASKQLAVPIAGQPAPVVFAMSGAMVLLIYAYGWLLAVAARRLVRLAPRLRSTPALVDASPIARPSVKA